MKDNVKINRRNFIKSSVLTGGALLAHAAMPVSAAEVLSIQDKDEGKAAAATPCCVACATFICTAGLIRGSGRSTNTVS